MIPIAVLRTAQRYAVRCGCPRAQNNILTGSADGTMKVWELVSPPMPGAVVKPEPIDCFFGDDAGGRGRYRSVSTMYDSMV